MGAAVPNVERVRDGLLAEDPAQMPIVADERVLGTNRQHDVEALQLGDPPRTIEPRQELRGHAEIDIVAAMTVQKVVKALDRLGEVVASREAASLANRSGRRKAMLAALNAPKLQPCAMVAGWPFLASAIGRTSLRT